MNTPIEKVNQVIARVAMVPISEVTESATINQLGVSSFDRIECVLALEEAFQIELPQAVLENARTVADLKTAVQIALSQETTQQTS
jgi:acyl carrier protein